MPATNELKLGQILSIMDELKAVGVVDLAFSGGEPLLRHDIFEILTAGVEKGFCVGLGTNGWKIDQRCLEKLRSCGIHRLQISIDGLPENHDYIRRSGSFNNVLDVARQAVSVGLRVHLCYTPQRRNFRDLEALVSLAADVGVSLFNVSQFVPVGRGTAEDDLLPEEWESVMRKWKEMRDAFRGRMEFRSHLAQLVLVDRDLATRPEFGGCAAGRRQACITPQGYVTPCVLIPTIIGDLRHRSFREIWRTSQLIYQLQGARNFKGKCSGCPFVEKCGGCRATALACHGDLFGEDPHCWL
jgi:radical SAM protein with 4Fe4S-binding SPASM domain